MDLNAAAVYAREQLEIAHRDRTRQGNRVAPAGLTRREVQVLRLVADGATTHDIAEQLFISSKTADHHIQHVYTKIGVINRAAATRGPSIMGWWEWCSLTVPRASRSAGLD